MGFTDGGGLLGRVGDAGTITARDETAVTIVVLER